MSADISFEEAMAELDSIVHTLELGKIKLDDAVKIYERGQQLQKICTDRLAQAKMKIDQLVIENGTPTGIKPFETAEGKDA